MPQQAAGTLAATEFVLNGKSAAASSYLKHKLALLHDATKEADDKRLSRRQSSEPQSFSAGPTFAHSQV